MDNAKLNESLNTLLADYQVYYQKLRNFHWNVKGKFFFQLHEKFEELYTEVAEQIDEIAERILSRGATPLSNLSDYLDASRLEEAEVTLTGEQMVAALVEDLSSLVDYQRKLVDASHEADDVASANLLEEFADGQEKTLWMLRSFLGR